MYDVCVCVCLLGPYIFNQKKLIFYMRGEFLFLDCVYANNFCFNVNNRFFFALSQTNISGSLQKVFMYVHIRRKCCVCWQKIYIASNLSINKSIYDGEAFKLNACIYLFVRSPPATQKQFRELVQCMFSGYQSLAAFVYDGRRRRRAAQLASFYMQKNKFK